MAVRAITFPGQGSQAVGMGVELAAAFPIARHLFQEVDDALEQKLSKLMAEGPESELSDKSLTHITLSACRYARCSFPTVVSPSAAAGASATRCGA